MAAASFLKITGGPLWASGFQRSDNDPASIRWMMANPSIERTRNGMPRMALISFWAMRVLPLRAAHVKR